MLAFFIHLVFFMYSSSFQILQLMKQKEKQKCHLLTFLIQYWLYYRYWNHEFYRVGEGPHFHVPARTKCRKIKHFP